MLIKGSGLPSILLTFINQILSKKYIYQLLLMSSCYHPTASFCPLPLLFTALKWAYHPLWESMVCTMKPCRESYHVIYFWEDGTYQHLYKSPNINRPYPISEFTDLDQEKSNKSNSPGKLKYKQDTTGEFLHHGRSLMYVNFFCSTQSALLKYTLLSSLYWRYKWMLCCLSSFVWKQSLRCIIPRQCKLSYLPLLLYMGKKLCLPLISFQNSQKPPVHIHVYKFIKSQTWNLFWKLSVQYALWFYSFYKANVEESKSIIDFTGNLAVRTPLSTLDLNCMAFISSYTFLNKKIAIQRGHYCNSTTWAGW